MLEDELELFEKDEGLLRGDEVSDTVCIEEFLVAKKKVEARDDIILALLSWTAGVDSNIRAPYTGGSRSSIYRKKTLLNKLLNSSKGSVSLDKWLIHPAVPSIVDNIVMVEEEEDEEEEEEEEEEEKEVVDGDGEEDEMERKKDSGVIPMTSRK